MKNKLINILLASASLLFAASCSEAYLDDDSVIVVTQTEENQFDKWLKVNFVNPYNIEWMYR